LPRLSFHVFVFWASQPPGQVRADVLLCRLDIRVARRRRRRRRQTFPWGSLNSPGVGVSVGRLCISAEPQWLHSAHSRMRVVLGRLRSTVFIQPLEDLRVPHQIGVCLRYTCPCPTRRRAPTPASTPPGRHRRASHVFVPCTAVSQPRGTLLH